MLSARALSLNIDGPANYGATKTPGRLKARKENSAHPGARTANVKAHKAALRTPAPDGGLKPSKLFTDVKPPKAGARPLGDKTPFPNRQRRFDDGTPAPLGKLAFGKDGDGDAHLAVPETQLRPSSTRKSIRGRRSSGPAFETPVTNGRHWDVSDIEIAVPVEEVQEEVETEDYDEVEYGPPSAIERPYEPPFEMPDCREAGKRLFEMTHTCWYDDRDEVYYARDRETMDQGVLEATGFEASPTKWEALPLPELEDDDPFAAYRPTPQPSTKQGSKAPVAGPKLRAPSRATAPPSMKPAARAPLVRAPSARMAPSTTVLSTRTTRSASVAATSRTARSTTVAPTPAPSRPPTVAARRPATSASVRPSVRPARPGTSAGTAPSRTPTVSSLRKATKAVPAPAVDDLVLVFEGQDAAGDMDFKFDV